MRLIDADALKEYITKAYEEMKSEFKTDKYRDIAKLVTESFCMDIDEAPTVDAEPVVRCKDCRFYRFYDGTFGKGWMCFENNTARHGDDYCSRGRWKNERNR